MTTIKDIAREAGISFQAVASVLSHRGTSRVSEATRARVEEIAQKLGYRPNFGYKLFRKQRTATVAIVSAMRRFDGEEHLQTLCLRLMDAFNSLGYATYYDNSLTMDAEENLGRMRELISRGASHFVFIGAPIGHLEILAELDRHGLSYIGTDTYIPRHVMPDSQKAVEMVIRHLRSCVGEEYRLAIPLSGRPVTFNSLRIGALHQVYPEATVDELLERFVTPLPELTWHEEDYRTRMFQFGYAGTQKVMREHPNVRAIMFLSDDYAHGGCAWLQQHGYRLGEDFLVAGHNYDYTTQFSPLPIISVAFPLQEMVKALSIHALDSAPCQIKLDLSIIFHGTFKHQWQQRTE